MYHLVNNLLECLNHIKGIYQCAQIYSVFKTLPVYCTQGTDILVQKLYCSTPTAIKKKICSILPVWPQVLGLERAIFHYYLKKAATLQSALLMFPKNYKIDTYLWHKISLEAHLPIQRMYWQGSLTSITWV